MTTTTEPTFDALLPPAMATKAEQVGVNKANVEAINMFMLAVLAGAFIALGAVFSTTVTAGASGVLPYGITKLLGGVVFCLGLILVVIA
ncbi:MAG TPA: formate/nitrite transporter family protein, partial [Anaerolineales bacterium]|nr:formate/nitrite transporter family protein [Anaerolineales bacterium]